MNTGKEQIHKPSDGLDYPANAGRNETQQVYTGKDVGAKPAYAGHISDKPVKTGIATKRAVTLKEIL